MEEYFPDCCMVNPLRLVIFAECQTLTTMGIICKSWLVRGASHILTTHTVTHKPLYPSQRDPTAQQRPFLRSVIMWVCDCFGGMFVCTAPEKTAYRVTNLLSFYFSHCRKALVWWWWWLSVCGSGWTHCLVQCLTSFCLIKTLFCAIILLFNSCSSFNSFTTCPFQDKQQTLLLPVQETPWTWVATQIEREACGVFHSTARQKCKIGVWATQNL